jgi:hypothetical protein
MIPLDTSIIQHQTRLSISLTKYSIRIPNARLWAPWAEIVADDLKTARRHALLKEHGMDLPVSVENG